MILRLVLAAAITAVLVVAVRAFIGRRRRTDDGEQTTSTARRQRWLPWSVAVLVAIVLALTLTGRLHWIASLLAFMLAASARLLQLAPQLFTLHRLFRNFAGRPQGPPAPTPWFEPIATTDGSLDATVQSGQYAGRRLSELTLPELLSLRSSVGSDLASLRLLLMHIVGRSSPGTGGSAAKPLATTLGRAEAAAMLGVAVDAPEDDIVAAHRRLMQRLHPDRGGTDYLAARINEAREVLLGRK